MEWISKLYISVTRSLLTKKIQININFASGSGDRKIKYRKVSRARCYLTLLIFFISIYGILLPLIDEPIVLLKSLFITLVAATPCVVGLEFVAYFRDTGTVW